MKETIYTIPVTEAFEKKCGCPICTIYSMLEKNEIDIILGASMMEPDVRIATNKLGFCDKHYYLLSKGGKKLPLALILQSHLISVKENLHNQKLGGKIKALQKLNDSCYICSRIDSYINKIYETIFFLYADSIEFKELFRAQELFCFTHFLELLKRSEKSINKKYAGQFFDDISKVQDKYFDELSSDLDWFVKKFDYRFEQEPWGNSKNSVERAIYLLSSEKL